MDEEEKMKIKEITMRTKPENILKAFRENDLVNLRTPKGYIYLVGGILNKLEGDRHFIAIDKCWCEVC